MENKKKTFIEKRYDIKGDKNFKIELASYQRKNNYFNNQYSTAYLNNYIKLPVCRVRFVLRSKITIIAYFRAIANRRRN